MSVRVRLAAHMHISISYSLNAADTIVIFAWRDTAKSSVVYSKHLSNLNDSIGKIVVDIANTEEFDATVGKTFVVHTHGKISARKVMVAGLGALSDVSVASLQKSGAAIARRLQDGKTVSAVVYLDVSSIRSVAYDKVVQSISEGLLLGSYTFTEHKTVGKDKEHSVVSCMLITETQKDEVAAASLERAGIIASAVSYTRDLVNEPPSVTTPGYLASRAEGIVEGKKDMSCEIFGKVDLKKMKMGGILGIASGTEVEPKFIKLEYNGGGDKTIALIGKGITFDTGGLSLKPANAMETMKMDMAGAAAVLGVFSALDALRPTVNVVGLISATENMPGPNAIKPGDIVTTMNGKTIEILNTDAEGRVVLADALSYTVSVVKPDVMIDLATLTGACIVALGEEVSGLFSNNAALARELLSDAKAAGELLWHMPLVDEYREHIRSRVADIKNMGNGKWGGAITAALFLQEFTDVGVPWAHLDIAGPAFAEKDMILSPYGGTGYGVRLLLSYLCKRG